MRAMYETLLAGGAAGAGEIYGLVFPDTAEEAREAARTLAPVVHPDNVVHVTVRERLPRGALSAASEHVIQPYDRGSAPAIMLALLRLLPLDPDALVVVVAPDVRLVDPVGLRNAVIHAAGEIDHDPDLIVLLAARPSVPPVRDGWLLPIPDGEPVRPLMGYVATPSPDHRLVLLEAGGLVDTGVVVASGRSLLRLLLDACPAWGATLSDAVWNERAVEQVYSRLDPACFVRDVLERHPWCFSVLEVARAVYSTVPVTGARSPQVTRNSARRFLDQAPSF